VPAASSKAGSSDSKFPKASLWSTFFTSGFSVDETYSESSSSEKKTVHSRNSGWAAAVRKVVSGGSMRRFQERVLGSIRTDVSSSDGDIWLLGVCHKISPHESTGDVDTRNVFAAFEQDFFSKILITYRKGLLNVYYFYIQYDFQMIDSRLTNLNIHTLQVLTQLKIQSIQVMLIGVVCFEAVRCLLPRYYAVYLMFVYGLNFCHIVLS
jgi:hypothetical protein